MTIESIFGITLGYHPDTLTYLENSGPDLPFDFIDNPFQFFGNFYYVLVSIFDKNIIIILSINIILFALTNFCIYLKIKNYLSNNGYFYFFSCLILIFDPYRAHLSVHILKDTLIIFSFILLLCNLNNISSFFFLILGFFLRFQFYGYLPIIFAFLSKRNASIIIVVLLISSQFLSFGAFSDLNKPDLAFRDFDLVPNFVYLSNPYGDILRSLTWPIVRLFNLAFIFHPIYFLFFLQSLALIYLIFFNKSYLNFKFLFFLFVLALIAFAAPGYNSYLRYTQPVITALFLWVNTSTIKAELKKYK